MQNHAGAEQPSPEVDDERVEAHPSCVAVCMRGASEIVDEEPKRASSKISLVSQLPAKPADLASYDSPSASWARPLSVKLHVYDVGMSSSLGLLNKLLRPIGSGAFHCGVEVLGAEWSFTDIVDPIKRLGTGVFVCPPQQCPGHIYSESVPMGKAYTSELELCKMIKHMEREWQCRAYDALTHNCCHFVNEFCVRLGLGAIPAWITHLAAIGAQAEDVTDTTCCRTMSTEVSASLCCQHEVNGMPYDFRAFKQGAESTDGELQEVNALPALSSFPARRGRRLTPRCDKWTVVESLDDDKPLKAVNSLQQHQWWRRSAAVDPRSKTRKRVISLGSVPVSSAVDLRGE